MDPMPPTGPPAGPPPTDPLASAFDPSGSPGPSGGKVGLIIGIGAFLGVLLVGGILLLVSSSGDDGGSDEASGSASAVADDDASEPADTEPEDEDDEVGDFTGEPSDNDDDEVDDTVPPPTTVVEELDLFADPTPWFETFADEVGADAQVVEAAFYPDYGFLTTRDPDNPNRILEYRWVNQDLEGPEPREPLPGTNFDTAVFRLRAIPYDRIPILVRRAPERVGIPDGHVTHILIDQAFTAQPTIRVYVTSADEVEGDYALANLQGQFIDR